MKTNQKKFWVALAGVSFSLFFSCQDDFITNEQFNTTETSTEAATARTKNASYQHVPNEFLIKFKEGTSESTRSQALAKVSGKVFETILTNTMRRANIKDGIFLVHTSMNAMDAIGKLKGGREIEYVEPNYIYNHYDTPIYTSNDPYYTNRSLWGMYGSSTSPSNQYGCGAGTAWASGHTGSSTVYVGIIDEGYMYMHEDLAANSGTNPGETPGDGIDDDGNGYVDDVYGWDFDGNNNSVFDGVNDDHGTHVAGTIGAVGGNGKGVAGVCWNIKLMCAKFLGQYGGTTANAIKAVDYFTDLKTRHNLNLVATSNSWGGGGFSQGLKEAIGRANTAGILFIAAAGNSSSNIDASPSYPASYDNDNIIAVASITSTGGLSGFSNYGFTTVDLGAPGSGIWSCVPLRSKGKIVVSGYASYSGTSMATPHVSGAAALYKSANSNSGATASDIKNAIMGSTVSTSSSLSGKCVSGGRLDVSRF